MSDIKFIKQPGNIYNLFSLFSVYFNVDYFEKEPLGYQYASEDVDYLKEMVKPYLPISDDLLLFFYIKNNDHTFMTKYYFSHYKKEFLIDNFGLAKIQSDLSNYDHVIDEMYQFYFTDIDEEQISKCKESIIELDGLIKNTQYSDKIKAAMYSFFINPIPTIKKLSYELMEKEFLFKQEYDKNIKEISEFQYDIKNHNIFEILKNLDSSFDFNTYKTIYISPGINLRQVIYKNYISNDELLLIVGLDLKRYVDYKYNQLMSSDLDIFGSVISEKNRLRILSFIGQRKEATIKEIEKELDLTATNSYYHLAYMIRIGMLKTRNRGRTIIYRINDDYFIGVISTLQGYLSLNKEGK